MTNQENNIIIEYVIKQKEVEFMRKHDMWMAEIRTQWGWMKQERIFNSYEEAEEVCDNLGYAPNEYRILPIKVKKKRINKIKEFLENLLTNE